MFELKSYQAKALDTLDDFFRRLRVAGRDEAWRQALEAQGQKARAYDASALGDVPAVCVRIPTGGGKTFLAAHAVARIGKTLLDTDAPVALWLVPSDAIRQQTLSALQSPHHPCRRALAQHFGDRVRVCGLDEVATIGRHELGQSAIVIVATIQAFNVQRQSTRHVYSFDESLAPHFEGLTPQQQAPLTKVNEEDLAAQPYLTRADLGRVKTSLANWLALARPIVVVDEAHNNRTDQAFRTLKGLNPSCVVELTATPVRGSNVLFHVGAQALQREQMIKLPIVLMEHATGWKDAVRDAVLTRDRLETLAQKEPDYVRPIVLFQAQPKGGDVTVDVLVEHLTSADGEKIAREQIAVATGDQKELDGVQIGAADCPVRYVVTVEALKEGWDCPFAYVLCSLQDVKSGKDVEQLLGRVLRMPYARSRAQDELNRAWAHVVAPSFSQAADALTDRLVENMGFEAWEAASAFVPSQAPQDELPLFAGGSPRPPPPRVTVPLPQLPTVSVPVPLAGSLEVRETLNGATAVITGELSEEVENFLLEIVPPKEREKVRANIEKARAQQQAVLAPSARGVPFAPLPQLHLEVDGELQLVERRMLSTIGDFDLFQDAMSLDGFNVREQGRAFEIDVDGGRVRYEALSTVQLALDTVPAHTSEPDLVRWLDRECRQSDVPQAKLVKWLLQLVQHLKHDRGMSLTALVRAKFQLAEAIRREIDRRRRLAIARGFQQSLPGFVTPPQLEAGFLYEFRFRADGYPARPPFYSGRYRFKKHYYGNDKIHDLWEKTDSGAVSEEFVCAKAIDLHPKVKHWVRNVEREAKDSFWLPTSTDYFYPDFVAELDDGRLLAVEYKGEHLLSSDDTREKRQVGRHWETSSGGRCLFLLAVKSDERGRDVSQQLDDKLAGRD